MSHTHENKAISCLPWYRYPMVWFVILLPMSVVAASFVTMAIAFEHAPEIVPTGAVIESSEPPLVDASGS